MLDSVKTIHTAYGTELYYIEWLFTILFAFEYGLRISCVGKPSKYIFSFYGIVDLMAIVPTFISLVVPGTQYLLVIRFLRVLRIFRVLKFVQYLSEAKTLGIAIRASRKKITVFLFVVLTMVVILGSIMYLIESEESGFTSIPQSIYWAIVTLTTVGYGDISPATPLGRSLAALIMILGYAIIAVPTGIMTVEMSRVKNDSVSTQACPHCSLEGHDPDAVYCKYCGSKL